MNKKEKDLLLYLSKQNAPKKSSEIIQALNISRRTLNNYVTSINSLCDSKIIHSSNKGYTINKNLASSLLLDDTDAIPQDAKEREHFIIKHLMINQHSELNIYDLCDQLFIGYSTLKSLLSKMNKTYSSYQIRFICKNDHVFIEGNEKEKRRLISHIISEESNNSYADIKQIQSMFPKIDVQKLYLILIRSCKKYGFYLNDFAAYNLLLHIVIIIDRTMAGNRLATGISEINYGTKEEKDLTETIFKNIKEAFAIEFNHYEKSEIDLLIKSNINYSLPTSQNELKHIVGDSIFELSKYYISMIKNLYMIDLENEAFLTAFSLHLKNLILRAENENFTPNPMTEFIQQNNPTIFDMAICICADLVDRFHFQINKDEIAFIALHIGAEIEKQNTNSSKLTVMLLCPEYRTTDSQIINQLMVNFGNQINIIKTIHSEEEIKTQEIDILFTTINLKHQYHFKVIYLSPIGIPSQILQIQQEIQDVKEKYQNQILHSHFDTFFSEDLFLYQNEKTDKETIIDQLCSKLQQKGNISSGFRKQVYVRESMASTAFGGIAIPHSISMDAIKTSVAVAISDNGIQWDKEHVVYIVMLVAISRTDKEFFRNLYESLIQIFSEPDKLSEVRQCQDLKQFKNIILF